MEPRRLVQVLRRVEEIPLEYMVTGSIAAILYGKPRLTHDLDMVVAFSSDKIALFCAKFATEDFYCPPEEVLQRESTRGDGGHFNLIDQQTGFKFDFYPFRSDPLARWGFTRKKQLEFLPKESIWVAPPEYVICHKLIFYRKGGSDKHLTDIQSILDVSGHELDRNALVMWIEKLGLEAEWNKVRNT